jgi:methanogenic corrinoid protein MtbC1
VQQGHAIGQIAGLATPELQGLLEIPAYSNPEPLPDLLAPVFEAIERFDGGRAADELSRLAAILAPRDFVYQVALPLMRETGIRWHSGQLAISQEHLLSQILRNLLGGMMRLFRHSGSAARIVFGTPAGESHEFGILAAAMLASLGGLEPVYLGPDLPALEIVRAAERSAAAIVVLAVTHPLRSSVEEIRTVAEGLPPGVEFWVGGDGSEGLDFSGISRPVVRVKDLAAFEAQCLRRRTEHGQKH